MPTEPLTALIKSHAAVEKNGIYIAKEIAEKTVWDKLAVENPTHAVISSKNEADAALKSAAQISDIKSFLKPTDVLIDCGTGYGRVAKYLLPEMALGGYIGVDSSYEMLSLFAQRYRLNEDEQQTPLLLLNADIHTLPLIDGSADVAIVCAVFLHNHKSIVEKAMAEIKRVVKPGGTVLIYSSFPRAATFMGLQGHMYQALLNLLGRPFKNGPVRYYRGKEIKKLFDGFAKVELRPVGFAVLPKTIIGLPRPLEIAWRVGFANPINHVLERITPVFLKPYLAVHFDVVATR
ncbi:MAG: hypothetical protein RLZZ230_972 [Candidatus Parcubacteria bacterium]|jgi:ubiquinone/menaquinone biosynthesis C-methylase UbiE